MAIDQQRITTIIFDYGNTLIEFGRDLITDERRTFERVLSGMFGHCDAERVNHIRDRQIIAPYHNGYRENDLREITAELIREVYGHEPKDDHVDRLIDERHRWFVETVTLPDDVGPLLERLGERYRMALLSNFPNGQSIRESLERLNLTRFFETVVVSADVGLVKPHRKPFDTLLNRIGASPGECVMVGDNWLADIQGSKNLGMQAVHTTQYVPYENFESYDNDHQPDATIHTFAELEALLA